MPVRLLALDVLLVAAAGLVNEHQLRVIEYLLEENRILREMLGKKRLRFTDVQRRRLAAKAKLLGRAVLNRIATIVKPDTLLRWHRQLIAMKWDYSSKRGPGRPRLVETIRRLVVQFALDNPWWGDTKIQGTLTWPPENGPRSDHVTSGPGPWMEVSHEQEALQHRADHPEATAGRGRAGQGPVCG